jgi:nucleolar pre-ribosomal-associated protein 1
LDDGPIVVKFLDECFLRCSRTPYKYLEDLSSLTTSLLPSPREPAEDSIIQRPEMFPSPVIMTLLEQLSVLTKRNPSPSELYSLSVFTRHLVFRLAQKTQSLWFTQAIVTKVDEIFSVNFLPDYPSIMKAVRREVRVLRACLAGLEDPPPSTSSTATDQMQTFLAKVEGTPLGTLFNNFYPTLEIETQEQVLRKRSVWLPLWNL